MNNYEPGIRYPRRRDDWMRDHPLASRLLIMIVGFAVLVPIAIVIRSSQGNVVRSGGLPGAFVGADPLVVASSSTSSTASAVAAAAVPTTVAPGPTAAPAAATTAAPSTVPPATVAAAEAVPATTAAKKKAAPTTEATAPATTAKKKVSTTTASTTPPTTKAAPTTTDPPTTPAPPTTAAAAVAPPSNSYSKEDVEAIIRSVFPAEEADEAVRIARRESNLVPTVRNWCCYGLFQIYFDMNKKTLAPLGITSAEQLYDPVVNTQAAYVLFQRSGWAPWR